MGLLRAGINFELKSRMDSGSVLFIHGLFMPSWIMLPLAHRLNRNGFHCFGYDYPTRIRRGGQNWQQSFRAFPNPGLMWLPTVWAD